MDRCSIKHGKDSKSTSKSMISSEYRSILGKRSSILLCRQIQNLKLNSAPIVRWIIIRNPTR
ncbi:hypothetical protein BH18THE2_BH18THE2_32390 [soil metagenome]